jgi:hypothetical protein
MLDELVTLYRVEIIRRCSAKMVARVAPSVLEAEIDHGVPMFLDQLVDELRLGLSRNPEISRTASQHGHDLLLRGFTVSQLVHGYGDICQSITEIAVELNAPISADDFRVLNRCLDDAIAAAVTQYGREREESLEGGGAGDSERIGILARELAYSIHSARVALEAISSGRVGIAGSTGRVLDRSLSGAHDLIDRLVAEVHVRRTTDAAM